MDQTGSAIPAVAVAGAVAAALALLRRQSGGDGQPLVKMAIAAAAVARATAAILTAFDRVHADRRAAIQGRVLGRLAREVPTAAPDTLRALARAEVERERTFQAKARVRLERDMPAALAIEDPEQRRIAVRKILVREQRYAELREDAIAARIGGQVEFDRLRAVLEPQGVTGMFWRLNPRLEHCARCLALAGKILPWALLALLHPPMHLNCGCRLWSPENAFRFGWATAASVLSVDEALSLLHVLESSADPVRDPEGFWLRETFNPNQARDEHGRWRRAGWLRFDDRAAAGDWAGTHFAAWAASLSRGERSALKLYKDDANQRYQVINGDLRAGRTVNAMVLREAPLIDAALRRGALPERTTLFRAVPESHLQAAWPPAIGQLLEEDGFASTSLLRQVAINDYGAHRDRPVLLEIGAQEGTPAGYLDVVGEGSDDREILLPAGARLQVQSVHGRHADIRVIRAELVGFRRPALLGDSA